MVPPRWVLVTGTTSGIGRATALLLVRQGFHVIATGRRDADLAELEREAGASGQLKTLLLDVADAGSIAAAVQAVGTITSGSGLYGLVNNAGYGQSGPLELVGDAEIRKQFEVNVFGLMALTRAFLPAMRERGEGRIVNVSSIVGKVCLPFQAVYCATKFAVEALSDGLRREVAGFGVRVSIVEPGTIASRFEQTAFRTAEPFVAGSSVYSGAMARWKKLVGRVYAAAVGPGCVARAIARALTAGRPCARYVAPWYGWGLVALVTLVPARALDVVLSLAMGLTRARMGKRAG